MGRYLIRRLLQALLLLALVSLGMFLLIHALPGGPEQVIFNPRLSAAGRAAIRARFGLDQPLPIQYIKWLGNALQGDFGFSFVTNQPVSELISQRFPATLELFGWALSIALVLAIILGVIAGTRQGSLTDYTLTVLAYFGIAMPVFLFGLFAQTIFGVYLHWLPTSGTQSLGFTFDPFSAFLDHVSHLLLPMAVLSITFIAAWSRYMRSSMIEVSKQDYMRTARAKGVAPVPLLMRHALRNAVIPLITIVAIDFGQVAGGATITEGIFAWPGMGLLFIDSLTNRDFPVLLAMLLIGAVFVVMFNLLADILYAVMDPRIRYS
ncbi:MAG: oligopeptide ABC transporter permease AppB [Ktedonobacteraceae bacterium]